MSEDSQPQNYAMVPVFLSDSLDLILFIYLFLPGTRWPGLCMNNYTDFVRTACGSHLDRVYAKIKRRKYI